MPADIWLGVSYYYLYEAGWHMHVVSLQALISLLYKFIKMCTYTISDTATT